jgi:hypothetical protein
MTVGGKRATHQGLWEINNQAFHHNARSVCKKIENWNTIRDFEILEKNRKEVRDENGSAWDNQEEERRESPIMNRPTRTKHYERRRQVANHAIKGWARAAIARQLNIPQATVSRDLAAMRKFWRDFPVYDFEQIRPKRLRGTDGRADRRPHVGTRAGLLSEPAPEWKQERWVVWIQELMWRSLRNAMQSLRKKGPYAQVANCSQNWTHPETGSRFAVILRAFSGPAGFPKKTVNCATQVSVRQ